MPTDSSTPRRSGLRWISSRWAWLRAQLLGRRLAWRQARRSRRDLRALVRRLRRQEREDQKLLLALVARVRALQPLPPNLLWKSSDLREGLLPLWGSYQGLRGNPAWKHFQSRLADLERMTREGVLKGRRDSHGNDVTPELRAAYGIVLQVLSIPAEVERAKKLMERDLGLTSAVDSPYTPDEEFQ